MVTPARAHEFVCADCGALVVHVVYVANDQDVCFVCSWLRQVADDGDRANLRHFLDKSRFGDRRE